MVLKSHCLLIAGLAAACVFAASDDAPLLAPGVERWGVQEIALQSRKTYDNPFTDVTVQGRFRSQGKVVTVDGFYDGDHTWRVRFMPDTAGAWSFTTVSTDPELNGKSGSFAVIDPGPGNHGPVVVTSQRHFAYADGAPYFPLGTTLYNWLNRDRNLEIRTLATLSRNPFNKVRFLVFPKWMVFNRVDPPLFPYVQPQPGKFDLDRFDPEFFSHYESRIRDLAALGIEADIILFHPYDKWGFASMDPRHDDAYLRYVVARFAAFRNIWWTLANEFDVFPQQKDWRHLGELLARIDPYGHLRGIHNCCVAFYDNSQPWITHVILQDITPQRRTPAARDDSSIALDARKIGKPVLVDEYGYEGNNGMAWVVLGPREAVEEHWARLSRGNLRQPWQSALVVGRRRTRGRSAGAARLSEADYVRGALCRNGAGAGTDREWQSPDHRAGQTRVVLPFPFWPDHAPAPSPTELRRSRCSPLGTWLRTTAMVYQSQAQTDE